MKLTKPCTENFSEMAPTGEGRYCGTCCKTVVDFTKMNERQIVEYLRAHSGREVCGRFRSVQLERKNGFERFVHYLHEQLTPSVRVAPIRLALLAVLSGLMAFMSSCMGAVDRRYIDEEEHAKEKTGQDSIQKKKTEARPVDKGK